MTGDVGFELINAIFRKVDVCACIKRGVTGIIHVEVHEAGNDRCFNELYANCPHEGNYFKHAWVISLNKASHHIKIKCEFTFFFLLHLSLCCHGEGEKFGKSIIIDEFYELIISRSSL